MNRVLLVLVVILLFSPLTDLTITLPIGSMLGILCGGLIFLVIKDIEISVPDSWAKFLVSDPSTLRKD